MSPEGEGFEADRSKETLLFSSNARGYLKRISRTPPSGREAWLRRIFQSRRCVSRPVWRRKLRRS